MAAPTRPVSIPLGSRASAQDLTVGDELARSPAERLRARILERLRTSQKAGASRGDALAALFPHTVLPAQTYEDLTAALISGAHVLFFGPSGAGKTSLAKDVWELFPKDAWAVRG
ncbi:MAG: hypothetical protein ACREB9_06005, partial [Thermoplasmata archaeon]